MISKLYKCTCGSEGITIEIDPRGDCSLWFLTWRLGDMKGILDIRTRLRRCWEILRYGRVVCNDFIFDRDTALAIANEIIEKYKLEDSIRNSLLPVLEAEETLKYTSYYGIATNK